MIEGRPAARGDSLIASARTMPLHVKICGIRNLQEARAAVEAGADAVGFLLGLDYPSDDALEAANAREIACAIPPPVRKVLVTHRTTADDVAALFHAAACDAVQLHGAFPASESASLRRALGGAWIARVVHVDGEGSLERAEEAASWADAILLDTRTPDRVGGTGRTHDWSLSARIVAACAKPAILAGGLTPRNVADAVRRVRPFGVDVNSGVEDASGFKETSKLCRFVAQARAAAR